MHFNNNNNVYENRNSLPQSINVLRTRFLRPKDKVNEQLHLRRNHKKYSNSD